MAWNRWLGGVDIIGYCVMSETMQIVLDLFVGIT